MSESARFNMIETQIRPANVTDPRILAAMDAVAREKFVPRAGGRPGLCRCAGRGGAGPLSARPPQLRQGAAAGPGRRPDDRVLDVGCATGYSSAVLARLAGEVVALEQDADLVRVASELLANAVGKVEVVQGGLIEGFKGRAL